MAEKLYEGDLSYDMTEDDFRETFGKLGEVLSAKIIMDNETGRSKGFGSVEMANDEDGDKAITSLNGTSLLDGTITVSEARPQKERPRPGFGRGGGKKDNSWSQRFTSGSAKGDPFPEPEDLQAAGMTIYSGTSIKDVPLLLLILAS